MTGGKAQGPSLMGGLYLACSLPPTPSLLLFSLLSLAASDDRPHVTYLPSQFTIAHLCEMEKRASRLRGPPSHRIPPIVSIASQSSLILAEPMRKRRLTSCPPGSQVGLSSSLKLSPGLPPPHSVLVFVYTVLMRRSRSSPTLGPVPGMCRDAP